MDSLRKSEPVLVIGNFSAKINGKNRKVTLAYSRENEDVKPGVLSSIIRQSGLDRKLFK